MEGGGANPAEMEGGATPIPSGVTTLAGLHCYFSGTPHVSPVVVVACDVSGFEDPDIRDFANKIAQKGYYVVVPDFCRGDPFVPGGGIPFATWLKLHHPKGTALEDLKLVCKVLIYYHSGIGAIGVGWGAKVVAELAMLRPPLYPSLHVNFAVLLDPFSVAFDDFKGVGIPVLICQPQVIEDPPNAPHAYPRSSQLIQDTMDAPVVSFVKMVHGINYEKIFGDIEYDNLDEEEVVECKEKALEDIFDWIHKHIGRLPHFRDPAGFLEGQRQTPCEVGKINVTNDPVRY